MRSFIVFFLRRLGSDFGRSHKDWRSPYSSGESGSTWPATLSANVVLQRELSELSDRIFDPRFGSATRYRASVGAPAMNQVAMITSKSMHPQEELGMNGQIGLPQRWCARSQQACMFLFGPQNVSFGFISHFTICKPNTAMQQSNSPRPSRR